MMEAKRYGNALQLAENICNYYKRTRGVGHTLTMINGLKRTSEALVVGAMQAQAENIASDIGNPHIAPIGLNLIGSQSYHGRRLPMVFDNSATIALCQEVLELKELLRQCSMALLAGNTDFQHVLTMYLDDREEPCETS